MSRKVGLYGYLGKGNLGDEALGEVWTAFLAPEFSVVRAAPPRLPRGGVWIFCGGLLQDRTSFRSLLFYAGAVRMAGGAGGLASVGVELHRRPSRRIVRWALAGVGYISVRDPASQRELSSLGIEAPLYPDPAITWETGTSTTAPGGPVLVNLVPDLAASLREAVLVRADRLARGMGTEVKGLVMSPEDSRALPGLPLVRPGDVRSLVKEIAGAALVVAARLHALELALVAEVPFVALPYAGKVHGLLELLNGELPASVPQGADGWEAVLERGWREELGRAHRRLAAWAEEGMENVRRWLTDVA